MKQFLVTNPAHLRGRYRFDGHMYEDPHFLGHVIFQIDYFVSLIPLKGSRNSSISMSPNPVRWWP